ncbi:uncharacterized protein LY89DRAFT_720150 [Mollisia scopiformis]|uniref:FAD-binding FR-type domain-containing protein n=1 Tax=Mollisia scopiformis TaxID=149040 RepID=A0A194X3B4_MOLSC|nr:uncharacterized protein LY89DRAFT_720150 [Mollisia scopiformis]KUJ14661.1 hypothetical protein LY89DRAFT_720150 [Mollisia scopiformis]
MPWPYHLLDLTETEKHQRRLLLDRYAVYAQLSALIPIAAYQLYRLGAWVYAENQKAKVRYSAIPSSPAVRRDRASKTGTVVRKWRALVWWLEGEIAPTWGLRIHWVAGVSWMAWLLFLCIHQTGHDYLHITKRFGAIAASQFPLHYMLSMKSLYSPLNLAFGSSHEQLNPWHRLSGRIIYGLLFLHATWYLNFFVLAGVLAVRLVAPVVIIGYVAFFLINILFSTSLEKIRHWSYRVFFVIHLVVGMVLPPLLFFHARPLRIYMTEALALFIFDIICRKLDTITGYATITPVPHTKLIKLRLPVPTSKIQRFRDAPGQHVYLQVPPESTPPHTSSPSIHDLLFNPFTVASVSNTEVTLVLRTLKGPTTTTLEYLSHLSKAHPPINIEGPIGSSRHFPNLAADYDRILLVAGGVGSTFILPIYLHVRDQLIIEGKSSDRVTMIWSMRSSSEALWAIDSSSASETEEGGSIQDDENVQIFVTGHDSHHGHNAPEPSDGSVEMSEMARKGDESGVRITGRDRPDLRRIVGNVFRKGEGERVAVLVCGPAAMARELRRDVGRWVGRGREVWFHNESFG